MVTRTTIDLVAREVTFGGPSTDWWQQLATAVAGGLTFATLITLVLTPCLLMLGVNASAALARARSWSAGRHGRPRAPLPVGGAAQPAE
jgi:multidrug efflux pump